LRTNKRWLLIAAWLQVFVLIGVAPSDAGRMLFGLGRAKAPPPSGMTVFTETIGNAGSGKSPGMAGYSPIHRLAYFPDGAVSASQIAVPSVGGTNIPYSSGCVWPAQGGSSHDCPSWPDGSLRSSPQALWIPQLAAGASEQIVWTAKTGSYSNTPAVTPASITAVADPQVVLSEVNSSWPWEYNLSGPFTAGFGPGLHVGAYVSGGSVTSCVVRISAPSVSLGSYDQLCSNSGNTCSGPFQNGISTGSGGTGGGTQATFTVTLPSTCTVNTAGSGYTQIGASGTMTFDVDAILNKYGNTMPPTCSAELGAGTTTSGTYSAGAVTWGGTITGHISKGQILTDSLGATAVVTGTTSPFTVSAPLTSGAMTANTPVCITEEGPAYTEFKVFGPFSDTGVADAWERGTAYVGMWTLPGSGNYKITAVVYSDTAILKQNSYYPSYTFDADWKNGSTEIRGAAQGMGPWTRIVSETTAAGFFTLDPAQSGPAGASGGVDWLDLSGGFSESTSLALNSLIPWPTSGDANYIKASRAFLPLDETITPDVKVIPTSCTGTAYGVPTNCQGYYLPFDTQWTDSVQLFGNGGTHFFLSPDGGGQAYWRLAAPSASDHGASWYQQMWVGALAIMGDTAGSRLDDTWHMPNIDPNFSAPSAYTDGSYLFYSASCGYDSNWTCPGGNTPTSGGGYQAADHWPAGTPRSAYVLHGGWYFMLDMMKLQATAISWFSQDDEGRAETFNGHTYHDECFKDNSANRRTVAWCLNTLAGYYVWGMPNEPDHQYLKAVVENENFTMAYNWYHWVGQFSTDTGPVNSGSPYKLFDTSTNGTPTMPYDIRSTGVPYNIGNMFFMDNYGAMVLLYYQMVTNHSLTALENVASYWIDNYLIDTAAVNTCPFNIETYSAPQGDTLTQTPYAGHDMTNIATATNGGVFDQNTGEITATNGSSTLTINIVAGGNPGYRGNPTTDPPSGSTVFATNWCVNCGADTGGTNTIPTNLSGTTKYFYCRTATDTGYLSATSCPGAPITMTVPGGGTTQESFYGAWTFNQSCPAPSAGNWAFNFDSDDPGGHFAEWYATLRWAQALGHSNTATGLSNLSTVIGSANFNTTAPGSPLYGADTKFTP
jgi:hypothetical protein